MLYCPYRPVDGALCWVWYVMMNCNLLLANSDSSGDIIFYGFLAIVFGLPILIIAVKIYFKIKATADYREAVQAAAAEYRAWAARKPRAVPSPIVLNAGEEARYCSSASLYEPRAVLYTDYGGGSVQLTDELTIHSGSSRSASRQEWGWISNGRLVVTNERVVFVGDCACRNIPLASIMSLGYDVFNLTLTTSESQKPMEFGSVNGRILYDLLRQFTALLEASGQKRVPLLKDIPMGAERTPTFASEEPLEDEKTKRDCRPAAGILAWLGLLKDRLCNLIVYLERRYTPDANRVAYTPARRGEAQDVLAYNQYKVKRDEIIKGFRAKLRSEGLREDVTFQRPDLTERERQLLLERDRALGEARQEYERAVSRPASN